MSFKLKENFPNSDTDMVAAVSVPFKLTNKEHDENKKRYEDAMNANRKNAESTIPEEGSTGKKVKSDDLKKMHLSEELFDNYNGTLNEEWTPDAELKDCLNSIEDLLYRINDSFNGRGESWEELAIDGKEIFTTAIELLEYMSAYHDTDESLKESWQSAYDEITKVVKKNFPNEDKINLEVENLYNKHKGEEDWDTAYEKWKETSEDVDEDLDVKNSKYKVAESQIKKYNNGEMPPNWYPETYLEGLVMKKHITEEQASKLKNIIK